MKSGSLKQMAILKQAIPFAAIVGFGLALGAAVPTTQQGAPATQPAPNGIANAAPATRPVADASTRPAAMASSTQPSATTPPPVRPVAAAQPFGGRQGGQFGGGFPGGPGGGGGGGRADRNAGRGGPGGPGGTRGAQGVARGARGARGGTALTPEKVTDPLDNVVVMATAKPLTPEYIAFFNQARQSIFTKNFPISRPPPPPQAIPNPDENLVFNGVTNVGDKSEEIQAYIENTRMGTVVKVKAGQILADSKGQIIKIEENKMEYKSANGKTIMLSVGQTLMGADPYSVYVIGVTPTLVPTIPAASSGGAVNSTLAEMMRRRQEEQQKMGSASAIAPDPNAADPNAADGTFDPNNFDPGADPGADQ